MPDSAVTSRKRNYSTPLMMLSHDAIRALIPHEGAMCLLHDVLSYDDEHITCTAISHRDPGHPLREGGVLPAICGVEYAAQAMAVHGALMSGQNARAGVLAAIRDVTLGADRLDDIREALTVSARKLWNDEARLLYEFTIHAANIEIMRGRAAVALSAGNPVHSART